MSDMHISFELQLVQVLASQCYQGRVVGLGVRNWESHLLAFYFRP